MQLNFRLVDTSVEWRNPRTGWWDPVTSWSTRKAAEDALTKFQSHDFQGWESIKLSKSQQG